MEKIFQAHPALLWIKPGKTGQPERDLFFRCAQPLHRIASAQNDETGPNYTNRLKRTDCHPGAIRGNQFALKIQHDAFAELGHAGTFHPLPSGVQ